MGLDQEVSIKLRGEDPKKKIIYTDKDKAGITQFAGSRTDQEQSAAKEGPRPKRPQPQKQEKSKSQPQRTILSEMMGGSGKEPQIIRPAPRTDAAKSSAIPQPPQPPQPQAAEVTSQIVDPKEAFHMIQELGVPTGYERDLVIVGTSVYKQHGTEFLVPPDPPEGVFLAPDRVPRLIIENGVVKVVEILKKIDKAVKPKDDIQLDQGIEDLMNTFQIEIE